MNINFSRLSITLSILLSPYAQSEDNDEYKRNGAWIGFGSGVTFLSEKHLNDNYDDDSRGLSLKLDAGYDVNRHFGIYGTYDYFESGKYGHYLNTVGLGLRGRGHITDDLSIFVKGGVNYLFKGNNENGPSGSVGVGVEYNLTDSISLKMGVDYYSDLEITQNELGDLTQSYLGFAYRFGQTSEPEIVERIEVKEIEVIKEVEVFKEVISEPKIYSLSASKLFANNSSHMPSTKDLEELLFTLKNNNGLKITITGHTDNVGSDEYNFWLSERRARSVKSFFVENGIEGHRISASGKGSREPIANNQYEYGRNENRRVEITLY